jgi:hypothetical protein
MPNRLEDPSRTGLAGMTPAVHPLRSAAMKRLAVVLAPVVVLGSLMLAQASSGTELPKPVAQAADDIVPFVQPVADRRPVGSFADRGPRNGAAAQEVDVELVLAVDISYSMDEEEQRLQRQGYVEALTSREFLLAVREGLTGRIAVSYLEWAGFSEQRVVMPWRIIDGPDTARAFADELAAQPIRRVFRTSISGALMGAEKLFDESPYQGLRRVIDVSGDGPNNQGPLVLPTRDAVLAKGVVINGLPLLLKRPNVSMMDIADLDIYYEDCVTGGPGSFVIPVREASDFARAIKTKLVLEVASRPQPEWFGLDTALPVRFVQDRKPRISCTIGEKLWSDRWERNDR